MFSVQGAVRGGARCVGTRGSRALLVVHVSSVPRATVFVCVASLPPSHDELTWFVVGVCVLAMFCGCWVHLMAECVFPTWHCSCAMPCQCLGARYTLPHVCAGGLLVAVCGVCPCWAQRLCSPVCSVLRGLRVPARPLHPVRQLGVQPSIRGEVGRWWRWREARALWLWVGGGVPSEEGRVLGRGPADGAAHLQQRADDGAGAADVCAGEGEGAFVLSLHGETPCLAGAAFCWQWLLLGFVLVVLGPIPLWLALLKRGTW